jgi:hypothetical protein
MFFLKKRKSAAPEAFRARQIQFVGEQDGGPERQLKEALAAHFGSGKIVKVAYLARAQYEVQGPVNVVLCVRANPSPCPELVTSISRTFASMFGTQEHLDIIFLSNEQESDVRRVCRPFYASAEV